VRKVIHFKAMWLNVYCFEYTYRFNNQNSSSKVCHVYVCVWGFTKYKYL